MVRFFFSETVLRKVFVPLTTPDGVKAWFFELVCPGNAMSVYFQRLLLQKNATVNTNLGFDDVCKDKYVSVAFKQFGGSFQIDVSGGISYFKKGHSFWIQGAKMVRYQVEPELDWWNVAHQWEIQAAFFEDNNIEPIWCIDEIGSNLWGSLNYTTGQWSGMVGMIQRDEVDYAIYGFGLWSEYSKVAGFSPATDHYAAHWITRAPLALSPTWNLLGLFTKEYKSQLSQ